MFSGTLELRGELPVRGGFKDTLTSREETCDQYVHGLAPATTLWVVPTPSNADEVGGHAVTYTAGVPSDRPSSGYHGPGSYTQPSATVADLIIDSSSFIEGRAAAASIKVSDDGSGSLSFSGLVDTANNAVESGKVAWRCSD